MPKRFNNRPAGYAFVVYETEEQANAAVEKLDKQGTPAIQGFGTARVKMTDVQISP